MAQGGARRSADACGDRLGSGHPQVITGASEDDGHGRARPGYGVPCGPRDSRSGHPAEPGRPEKAMEP